MLDEWVEHAIALSKQPADFYSGCRKILQSRTISFYDWDDSLRMEHAGYTKSKMTMLVKNYLHEESHQVAQDLWALRKSKAKYGSVGFTCYNHFVKGGSIDAKRSKRASVFGPCIQAVTITWLSKTEYSVDIFYRTTEWLKKFPADLVFLRDVLLAPFDFSGMKMRVLNCHFANITIHPQYFITIVPQLSNPIKTLESIKKIDPYFWKWLIKWSSRYVCEEHHRGIAKFAQALRVKDDADKRLKGARRKEFIQYIRDNYPADSKPYVGGNAPPGSYPTGDEDDGDAEE